MQETRIQTRNKLQDTNGLEIDYWLLNIVWLLFLVSLRLTFKHYNNLSLKFKNVEIKICLFKIKQTYFNYIKP